MIDLSGYMLSVQCLKFIMAIGIIIYSQHLIWVVLAAPTSTRIFKMTVSNFRIKTSTYEKFIALVDFMVCIANNLRQAQLSTENISKATLSAPTSYVAMEKNIVLNIVGGQLGSQQSN